MSLEQVARYEGQIFGSQLARQHIALAIAEARIDNLDPADIADWLDFFCERATQIEEAAAEVGEDVRIIWRIAARERYRKGIEELIGETVDAWKRQAPCGKVHFNRFKRDYVGLAVMAFVFPDDLTISDDQRQAIRGYLDILAGLSGHKPMPAQAA